MTKLREQLLASERIVGANRTLLRKLQEQVCLQLLFYPVNARLRVYSTVVVVQVQRVEHRVTEKKSQAVRFERELSHAQLMANRGTKRRVDSGGVLVSGPGRSLFFGLSFWSNWKPLTRVWFLGREAAARGKPQVGEVL